PCDAPDEAWRLVRARPVHGRARQREAPTAEPERPVHGARARRGLSLRAALHAGARADPRHEGPAACEPPLAQFHSGCMGWITPRSPGLRVTRRNTCRVIGSTQKPSKFCGGVRASDLARVVMKAGGG